MKKNRTVRFDADKLAEYDKAANGNFSEVMRNLAEKWHAKVKKVQK